MPKPSRARSQVSLKELLTRSATSGSTLPIEAATETTSLLRRATNFSDPALDSISEHLRCLGVGINNDPVLCQLAYPPMSSVDPDGLRIGYAVAACLDRMMRGRRPPRKPIRIEPRGLVVRQSSDVVAVDDRDLAAALRFIRDRACSGIRIRDVLREVPLSRSVLERKFREYLDRSPHDEILRIRIARARELLVESDLSLCEVAVRAGFSNEKDLSDAFHREVGVRPGAFRKERWRTGVSPRERRRSE